MALAVGAFVLGLAAGSVAALVFSLVAAAILYGAARLYRLAFPGKGGLAVLVCEDAIEFRPPGRYPSCGGCSRSTATPGR